MNSELIIGIFKYIQKGITFIKSNSAKNFLAFVATVFFLFNILNVYTVNASGFIDMQKTYQVQSTVSGHLTGDTGPNSDLGVLNTFVGLINSFLTTIAPAVFSNIDDVANDPTIESYNKQGIMDFFEGQNVALLKSTPTINVPVALANDWVPGYEEANSGVYAATDGYSFLSEIGIDALWERTSLIAYVLFVVVLIAAGFMIMLRQKIGGQVAVTVFNALPNVIIGLILVPFSFAIIGLILNISMIGTNVIGGVLGVTDPVFVDNPISLVKELWFGGSVMEGLFDSGTGSWLAGGSAAAGLGMGIVGSAAGFFTLATAGAAGVGLIIGLLILVLIFVAIIAYASFRVYITLLTAYLSIIIDVILAPLVIAFGSIPGQENLTSNLFKRVLKNALVFPGVFLFLNLASFILQDQINISFPHGLAQGDWSAGGTDNGAIGGLLKAFLAIGMFFLAAEVPNFLADFIQVEGGKGAATAIDGARKAAAKIPIIGSFIAG